MKLIVLSLLLGGIASANGGTCKAKKLREGFEHLQSQGGEILDEVADIKAEVADLKAQVAEIKSLVEFIASEATEKPTAEPTPAPTAPPTVALNGCGEPCLGVETLDTQPSLTGFSLKSATTELTVSDGGKAGVFVRDPRPSRPPARKRRNSKRRPKVETPSPSSATARP